MRYSFVVIVILSLQAVLFGQLLTAKSNPYQLASDDALASLKKYNQAEFKAWNDYDHLVASARTQLLEDLRASQARATKAGNLDEAVRLRDAIADIQQAGVKTKVAEPAATKPDVLVKALIGSKWLKVEGKWTMTFHDDMTVTSTHHALAGTWAIVSPDQVRLSISMNNCSSVLLKVAADGKSLVDKSGAADFVFSGR